MPWSSRFVRPKVFLRYEGIAVYHVYKDDDVSQGERRYWYSTDPEASDDDSHGSNSVFDVRQLRTWEGCDGDYLSKEETAVMRETIRRAIADGEIAGATV